MVLANIVSKDDIKVSNIFRVVRTVTEIDRSLPTLIVGFDLVCELYPDFDILEFMLEPNFYWTFKRTEKRDKFEEDITKFTKIVYFELTKDIKYIHIDFILFKPKQLKKIFRKILSSDKIISVKYKDNVFIYIENFIFGLDLSFLEYAKFDINKLLLKIKSKSLNFLQDESIFIKYKKEIKILDNKEYYLPFLYSIKNEI